MQNIRTDNKNVDENDLKRMGSLSLDWWDPKGGFFVLQSLNQVRVPFIRDGLINNGAVNVEDRNKPDVLKGLNILEVGCGAGILTEALSKLGANVTGLEPSPELFEAAKKHLEGQSLNVNYLCEYIEDHSLKNANKYDAVVASEVVEHVPDQKIFIQELTKCVKLNGSIFITTPNRTFISWLFVKIFAEYILKILPKECHVWSHFIKPDEVMNILDDKECKTIDLRGIWYIPFADIFFGSAFNSMQYALHAVKDEGKRDK